MSRWIDLEGVVNMRDLGGLPTCDGGHTASGRLIRSDNLNDLTPEARHTLTARYGVTDVVDLRSPVERDLEGPAPLKGTSVRHHEYSLLADRPAPADRGEDRALPWESGPVRRDEAFWVGHYRRYLTDRPEAFSAAARAVATTSGAVIVHCAAGKDRTGTLVAVLLDAVGVPPAVIADDYGLTAQRLPAIWDRLITRPAYAESLSAQDQAEQVPHPGTMRVFLDWLRDRHGGGAGWLRGPGGWSRGEVDALRERLVSSGR